MAADAALKGEKIVPKADSALAMAVQDSSAMMPPAVAADSLESGDAVRVPTEKELADSVRAAKKARAEQARLDRINAREARWAELDARDAAKKAGKDAKALERKRKATAKAVIARDRREAREQALLERYMERYARKEARRKEREFAKQNKKNKQWKEEQE